jgi:hypothetical protein
MFDTDRHILPVGPMLPAGTSCRRASWMARVAVDGIKLTDGEVQFEDRFPVANDPRFGRDNDYNLLNIHA